MKTPGSTDEDIDNRRDKIQEIKLELRSEKKPITPDTVLKKLKEKGITVSYHIVYRDLVHLARGNTWVRDLGESTYSVRQEEIDRNLDAVLAEAWDLYNKSWTRNTTVKKSGSTSKGEFESIEETKTEELAAPKIEALKLIMEVSKLKMSHTNKDNIHIAAELLGRRVRELKNKAKELEELKAKNQTVDTQSVNILELAKKVN